MYGERAKPDRTSAEGAPRDDRAQAGEPTSDGPKLHGPGYGGFGSLGGRGLAAFAVMLIVAAAGYALVFAAIDRLFGN